MLPGEGSWEGFTPVRKESTYIAEIRIARTNRLLALLVRRAPERPVAQRALILHRPRVYGTGKE